MPEDPRDLHEPAIATGHGPEDTAKAAPSRRADNDVPRTIHDAFFKGLMGDSRNAAAALRAITPAPVAEQVDWTALQPERASLQRDGKIQTHADLLFKARWKPDETRTEKQTNEGKADQESTGPELYLHLIYEHQSTPDPWMPLRFFNMAHALWRRDRKRDQDARRLPAVLCYVLYHGAAPWTAPTSLIDLIDVPETIREHLRPYLPSLKFILDDLRIIEDTDLAARDMPPYAKIGLFLLRHGTSRDVAELLVRIAPVIAALLATPGGVILWNELIDYLWHINPLADEGLLGEALRPLLGPEVEHTMISYAQKLRNEGIDKGRDLGRDEGLLEGQRTMLLRQLAARFTSVPEPIETKVTEANLDEL